MDVVGLVGVVVALAIGIGSIWVSIWTNRESSRRAIDQLREARRVDAYLEFLRIVERYNALESERIFNAYAAEEIESGMMMRRDVGARRVDLPEADALLVAFGSPELRRAFGKWSQAHVDIDNAWDDLSHELTETNGRTPDATRLYNLGQVAAGCLEVIEVTVRRELGAA